MHYTWEDLISALRTELAEYGALRNILDDQQRAIFARDGERVTQLNIALNQQIEATAQYRQARDGIMRAIAQAHQLPTDVTLAGMNNIFPDTARPLFKAIAHEINSMITILRRRSRQNQMLLARTCETIEQTLRALRPSSFTKTYSAQGAVSLTIGPIGSHMQAVG